MDSGKADIAAQFPSVCKNVKPKTVSVGKNRNHKGAMQAGLPAFPHMHPTAKANLLLGEVENGTKCQKDIEFGQNDFCRGVVVVNGLASSQ